MSKTGFVRGLVFAALIIPMFGNAEASMGGASRAPNVVLILADDLGYGELGCYGNPDIRTPNLDRLATEGVRCTSGYSAFPVCSPSRAALMTGRYPARIGPSYEDYFGGGSPSLDPEKHTTIAQLMKENGYRTACFGKWNVANLEPISPVEFGFDRWVGFHFNHDFYTHRLIKDDELDMVVNRETVDYRRGDWSDTIFADEAIEFIQADKENPFFVYLAFQAPHDPIQDPDVPFAKPVSKKKIENRPILVKMIERLDTEVGRVLQTLEDEGVADNTLVIFTSDNGGAQVIGRNAPLNGAKQQLLEGGVRVPLIVRWPGIVPEGKVFDDPVTAMDLTATVASAGGVSARADQPFDGFDIVPALSGTGELDAERPLFFRRRTVVYWKGENMIRQSAVRQGDWKVLRTYKYGTDEYREDLFNLADDLAESKNLAHSNPEKLQQLQKMLDGWEDEMAETAAPMGKYVPKPKKAKSAPKKAAPASAGCLHRYRFEGNANDLNGKHAKPTGSGSFLEPPVYGSEIPAGAVPGAPDRSLRVGYNPASSKRSGLTIPAGVIREDKGSYSVWVQVEEGSSNGYLLNSIGSAVSSRLAFEDQTIRAKYDNGVKKFANLGIAKVKPGQWAHVVVTWDLSKKRMSYYLNGTPVASANDVASFKSGPVAIGSLQLSDTKLFDGSMHDLRSLIYDLQYYDRVLAESEVARLYAHPGSLAD